MFNRGLANVVTVVLVILIGLVVLGIGWNVVVPLFEKTEGGLDVPLTVNLDIVQGTVRTFNGSLEFYVERKSGQGEVVGVNVVMLSVSGTSETRKVNFVPMIKELEKRKVRIYHRLGDLAKVSIAPIYRTSKGEVIGNVVSSRVIPLYDFSCGNGQLELGTEQCEDGNLNLETCNSQGYQTSSSGGLRCTPQCTFDYTFCGPPLPGNTNVLGSGICDNGVDDDFDGFADFPQDPGCASLNDGDEADGVRDELFALSWSDVDNSLNYITPTARTAGLTSQTADYVRGFLNDNNIPSGKRALILYGDDIQNMLADNQNDYCVHQQTGLRYRCIWWDNGVSATRRAAQDFAAAYYSNSNSPTLDYLILDLEGNVNDMGNFQIGAGFANPPTPQSIQEANRWNSIKDNPRYPDTIRELNTIASQGNIQGIDFSMLSPNVLHDWNNENNYPSYLIWNEMTLKRVAGYLNEAIITQIATMQVQSPNHQTTPKSNAYGFSLHSSQYAVPDGNGHNSQRFGNGANVGTHQSMALYGFLGQITQNFPNHMNNYVSPYSETPFNAFRYEVNILRAAKLSAPSVDIMPWVAFRSYAGDGGEPTSLVYNTLLANSNYYNELVLHVALTNPEVILYFNNNAPTDDNLLLNNILSEFNQVAGFSDRESLISGDNDVDKFELTELTGWTENYVLTGMTSGDRNVWRLTPNEGYNLNTHEENNNLIVQLTGVNGKTFTFEQGRVYRLANGVSSTGIWIVQPRSAAMPTIS